MIILKFHSLEIFTNAKVRYVSSILIFFLEIYLTLHTTLYFCLLHADLSVFSKIFSKVIDHNSAVNSAQLHMMNIILYNCRAMSTVKYCQRERSKTYGEDSDKIPSFQKAELAR